MLHAPQVIRPRAPHLQLRAPQLLVVKRDLRLLPHRAAHLLEDRQVRPALSAVAKRDRLQLRPVQRDPPFQARRDLLARRPQGPLKDRPPMLLQRLLRDEERHHLALGNLQLREIGHLRREGEAKLRLIVLDRQPPGIAEKIDIALHRLRRDLQLLGHGAAVRIPPALDQLLELPQPRERRPRRPTRASAPHLSPRVPSCARRPLVPSWKPPSRARSCAASLSPSLLRLKQLFRLPRRAAG